MNLFLDDERTPVNCLEYVLDPTPYVDEERWKVVRNYDEFCVTIQTYYILYGKLPDLISFDHDLADEHYAPKNHWDETYHDWVEEQGFQEKTGYDCAKWLVDFCMENELILPAFLCHSMNPHGKKNIESYLNNFIKHQQENG